MPYQLFFALKQTDLVVRAKRGSEVLELVPPPKLIKDLPRSLIHDYVHWLNIRSRHMELRPIATRWESSIDNWVIKFNPGGTTMTRGSLKLIDIHSRTFAMVAALLKPIEEAENLVVSWSSKEKLSIELPRYRLSFFLNEDGLLECLNLPGMVIDSDQSIGSLVGLVNQLVLRTNHGMVKRAPSSRKVIIPCGQISFELHGHHSQTVVETKSQPSVKFLEYKVDPDLGRLVGNVSLVSRLFKIYLHAVTSHCLADPLTGLTGTEEALRELRGAACQSFQSLGIEEVGLLRHIAALAPRRTFYPHDLKVMQQIEWSSLPPMAQQYDFYPAVHDIIKHADRLSVFYRNTEAEAKGLNKGIRSDAEVYLSERAKLRTMVYNPVELAALLELSRNGNDVPYFSRDTPDLDNSGTHSESAAFATSHALYRWKASWNTPLRLLDTFKAWSLMGGLNQSTSFSYNRDWLQLDLADNWISIYELCRHSSKARDRFAMLFSFSSLAYTSPTSQHLLHTLLAFATSDQLYDLDTPSSPCFDLSKGFSPDRDKLASVMQSFAFEFEDSPEVDYEAYEWEDEEDAGSRRFALYEACVAGQINELVGHLMRQWPCEEPHIMDLPKDGEPWRFDICLYGQQVLNLFQDWFQNRELSIHTIELQSFLDAFPSSASPVATPYHFTTAHDQTDVNCPKVNPSGIDLFRQRTSHVLFNSAPQRLAVNFTRTRASHATSDDDRLKALISEFQHNKDPFYQLYGEELNKSRSNLTDDHIHISTANILHSFDTIADYRDDCFANYERVFSSIQEALAPKNTVEIALSIAGLWPRFTLRSLLGRMTLKGRAALSQGWRQALTILTTAMLIYQQSQRLLRWAVAENADEFNQELENEVIDEREEQTIDFDWLLIQVCSFSLRLNFNITYAYLPRRRWIVTSLRDPCKSALLKK